jgi:hypothetical protein
VALHLGSSSLKHIWTRVWTGHVTRSLSLGRLKHPSVSYGQLKSRACLQCLRTRVHADVSNLCSWTPKEATTRFKKNNLWTLFHAKHSLWSENLHFGSVCFTFYSEFQQEILITHTAPQEFKDTYVCKQRTKFIMDFKVTNYYYYYYYYSGFFFHSIQNVSEIKLTQMFTQRVLNISLQCLSFLQSWPSSPQRTDKQSLTI